MVSVLDSVHLVKVIGGKRLCLFQVVPQDLVWIEMMVVVDHKLQMAVAFFPYLYLIKMISSAGRDSSFLFRGWFHFWSSDVR